MNKELIIFEYFTSQEKLNIKSKKIFSEAINLVDSIAISFCKNTNIKKIHIIRNNKLKKLVNKKILFYSSPKKNMAFNSLINCKNQNKMILVAPEENKHFINLAERFRKKISLLNSDNETIKIVSSKIKTYGFLKKNRIPCIPIEETNNLGASKLLSKPEYGCGSNGIKFVNEIKKNSGVFFQKFYPDEKGSFTMLCKNGECVVLSCNKQIVKENMKSIRQVGLILGGLEKHRKEIKVLANLISKKLPGLFGFIGVDIIRHQKSWRVLEINPRFTSAYVGMEMAYGNDIKKITTNFYIKEDLIKKTPNLLKEKIIYFDQKF